MRWLQMKAKNMHQQLQLAGVFQHKRRTGCPERRKSLGWSPFFYYPNQQKQLLKILFGKMSQWIKMSITHVMYIICLDTMYSFSVWYVAKNKKNYRIFQKSCNGQDWARLKLRNLVLHLDLHMSGRSPSTWAIFLCCSWHMTRELHWK